jgi:two-component system, sensor histidine kinase and response regulator
LTPEQREYLNLSCASSETLLTVINDILDFSKVEAGKLELNPIEIHLREFVETAIRPLAPRAHEKGLELAIEIASGTHDHVIADPVRLRQTLVNLASNAVKFTERGEVVVSVEEKSRRDDRCVFHFTVRDTGIGIPADKQGLIFEAFTQADGSTTRAYGGTGLGLAISSRLVSMMNGQIWVESEPGRGSRFHFTAELGLSYAGERNVLTQDVAELADCRVLIVDDNATNRRILNDVLASWGMKPTVVAGGKDALEAARTTEKAGDPFRLVILDCHMPGIDGFETAKRMRAASRVARPIILMLTSGAQKGDESRCQELGIALHLIKPIRQGELRAAIREALGSGKRAPVRETSTRTEIAKSDHSLRVLLAEDNPVNQQVAMLLLEKMGHTVKIAGDGIAALEAVANEPFDVVLMDLQMPGMGGLEATANIRRNEEETGEHIPIIALTAHAMSGDRDKCINGGMDDYLSKPISARELAAKLAQLAASSLAPPDLAEPTESTSPVEPTVVPHRDAEEEPETLVVDFDAMLERAGGDRGVLMEVILTFLDDGPRILREIRALLEQGPGSGWERAAHSYKGAVAFFSEELAETIDQLERSERDPDCTRSFAQLERIERLATTLSSRLVAMTRGRIDDDPDVDPESVSVESTTKG